LYPVIVAWKLPKVNAREKRAKYISVFINNQLLLVVDLRDAEKPYAENRYTVNYLTKHQNGVSFYQ